MPSDHSSSSHCDSGGGGSYSGGGSFSGGGSYSDSGSYYDDSYSRYHDDRHYHGNGRPTEEEMYMTIRRTDPKIKAIKPAKGYYSFRCICCKNHDYRLFESDWKDKKGELHKAGWYDEFNNRYDAAALKGSRGATCICGNCGQNSTLNLDDNSTSQYECSNCRHIIKVAIDEEDKIKQLSSIGKEYVNSNKKGVYARYSSSNRNAFERSR